MRIQHNIAALNSYRQLNGNNSAVSKNLEKLSSGYKINRAADDAAGLVISEKMRAQITGLTVAQKNANDGISLVQTAEGALTEVHDMLNRMKELATQASNGTYSDDDRKKLQSEITALNSEIDRISEGTNFNGINLLDGSMGGGAEITQKAGTDLIPGSAAESGAAASFTIDLNGASGMVTGSTYTLTIGTSVVTSNAVSSASATASDLATAFNGTTVSIDGITFNIAASGTALTFTAQTDEKLDGVTAGGTTVTLGTGTGVQTAVSGTLTIADLDVGKDPIAAGSDTAATSSVTTLDFSDLKGIDVIGSKYKFGDQTYEFVKTGEDATEAGAMVIQVDENFTAAEIAAAMAGELNVTGYDVEDDGNTVTLTAQTAGKDTAPVDVEVVGSGLSLQIGDTAETFNKLDVAVASMDSKSLGLDGVDIGTEQGASDAIKLIDTAIDTVSTTRSNLGAIQNRLEHTINNLGVTTENLTSAESRIRDTDMADEMMAYTKNNILVQAAQAMLAQANTVPQGVLQLLQ